MGKSKKHLIAINYKILTITTCNGCFSEMPGFTKDSSTFPEARCFNSCSCAFFAIRTTTTIIKIINKSQEQTKQQLIRVCSYKFEFCERKSNWSNLSTNEGRVDGFPLSESGRYSAIALVATSARRYSTTPLLSTACSLCSKRLMTDSGLENKSTHYRECEAVGIV